MNVLDKGPLAFSQLMVWSFMVIHARVLQEERRHIAVSFAQLNSLRHILEMYVPHLNSAATIGRSMPMKESM